MKKTNSIFLGFLKILTKNYSSSFTQNTECRVINDHTSVLKISKQYHMILKLFDFYFTKFIASSL